MNTVLFVNTTIGFSENLFLVNTAIITASVSYEFPYLIKLWLHAVDFLIFCKFFN